MYLLRWIILHRHSTLFSSPAWCVAWDPLLLLLCPSVLHAILSSVSLRCAWWFTRMFSFPPSLPSHFFASIPSACFLSLLLLPPVCCRCPRQPCTGTFSAICAAVRALRILEQRVYSVMLRSHAGSTGHCCLCRSAHPVLHGFVVPLPAYPWMVLTSFFCTLANWLLLCTKEPFPGTFCFFCLYCLLHFILLLSVPGSSATTLLFSFSINNLPAFCYLCFCSVLPLPCMFEHCYLSLVTRLR